MVPRSRCSATCTHDTEAECIMALRQAMRARLDLPLPTPFPHGRSPRLRPPRRRNEDILTITEAAELVGMSRSTLYNWLREGKIAGFWLPGGQRRIHRDALLLLVPPDNKKAGTPEGIPARLQEWKKVTSS